MRIGEVRPNQRVKEKRTGKEFLVRGYGYPYNSFMARRMVALIGAERLYRANELELLEDPDE